MKYIVICLFLFALQSCGAIGGMQSNVHVVSQPTGAYVSESGHYLGTTPFSTSMDKREPHNLTFLLEKHVTQSYEIKSHVDAGTAVIDFLFGFLPLLVDAASDGWRALDLPSNEDGIKQLSVQMQLGSNQPLTQPTQQEPLSSKMDALEKLGRLRQSGVLTEDEFQKEKQKILSK